MNERLALLYANTVQNLRGWNYEEALARLEKTQWLSEDEIQAERLVLMHKLLEHSNEHVPYYRSLWAKIGFEPLNVQRESDISTLPIITKSDLRKDYEQFKSDIPIPFDIWKSSGSTGEPFPFVLDKNSIIINGYAAFLRGRRWWEFKEGQREAMIWSGLSDISGSVTSRMNALKRQISWSLKNVSLLDVYNLNEPRIRDGYQAFKKHQPVVIRAIASGLYRFCAGLNEYNLDGSELGVRAAIFTGEGLSGSQRSVIEKTLNCKTISEYGCTELGILAFECPEGGLHLSHENYFLEFLKDGKPAKPGDIAELVVTNLNNLAFPLIRYSVGDYVELSGKLCACGRTLPLINSVTGRVHDSILALDGSEIHGLFFSHIFDELDSIHQFRIIQQADSKLDIELVSPEKVDESIIENVRRMVAEKYGSIEKIRAYQVVEIPALVSGKTPWIVSKMDTN